MKPLMKLGSIIFILSCLNSCCPFASNTIQSTIHEDSYAWLTVYDSDTRLYESKFMRQWADSTVSFVNTTTFSEYNFFSGECNGECSPTCEIIECRDEALSINGEGNLLIFSIPSHQLDRSFDFIIDNNGEVIDSIEISENNGWEQSLSFVKKNIIEFNENTYGNCFQIEYVESIPFKKNSFNFIYCKNEGVIVKEEITESFDTDQNQILILTKTYTIL